MSRYHVSSSEGQYEKDSGEQVLANKLGIATSDEMDEAELVLLEQLYQSVFEKQFPEGQLSVAMLKSWHRRWLCKHPSFSSMHFLSVPVFQPSADTLPASGYSGIHEAARCYIPSASAR